MRLRASLLVLGLLVSHGGGLARAETAPLSETELSAARKLFAEAVALQKEGKFSDALEKYQRSFKVVQAPTTLERMGECEAALGKWVSAAERFRQTIRMQLPKDASPQFVQAQETAKAELAALEPRIPHLRVDVNPKDAKNLELRIDGKAIHAALVGEEIPVDPGAHAVVAVAEGLVSPEERVEIKEREKKSIVLTLAKGTLATGGPLPPATQTPSTKAAKKDSTRAMFLIGGRLGATFPGGNIEEAQGVARKLGDYAGAGPNFGLTVGAELLGHLLLGLELEHARLSKGSNPSAEYPNSTPDQQITNTASTTVLGLLGAFSSNPEGFGFYAELGIGFRFLNFSSKLEDGTLGASMLRDFSLQSGSFRFGLGATLSPHQSLRLVPKVTVGLGSFTKYDFDCTGTGAFSTQCTGTGKDQTIVNTSGHHFVFLGLDGYFQTRL